MNNGVDQWNTELTAKINRISLMQFKKSSLLAPASFTDPGSRKGHQQVWAPLLLL
ncbi:MAG: hypothetical protein KAH31_06420 [Candidatus Sabulitectum sp.]|nr:hypothetical protein [Candidatus Sabulitectum sp.]